MKIVPVEGYEPLPSEQWRRLEILHNDSTEYIRRLSSSDVDRLLYSLAVKAEGLSAAEVRDMLVGRWNVDPEFVPDYLKD